MALTFRNYRLESLRRHIGLAPQDIFLWNNSIFENIAYPDAIEAEAVADAAERTNLHAFVESLPEKYETIVGERGSGAVRRRAPDGWRYAARS